MINQCFLLNETALDPAHNLAVESALLHTARKNTCVLYLWQNQHTVVIGRNQDAWRECRVAQLAADGGTLARRATGGGAVYHDLGNLNFSLILPQEDYEVPRQLTVLLQALAAYGLHAEASGRNDITLNGRKFSGNAFLQQNGFCLHHGTLLVQVDLQRLGKYLRPSELKLQSKGIASVPSRVVNLQDQNPLITVNSLRETLADALCNVYHAPLTVLPAMEPQNPLLRGYLEKYRSRSWVLGQTGTFDCEVHDRFLWGEARLGVTLHGHTIADTTLYTDAMDPHLPVVVRSALLGQSFTADTLARLQQQSSGTPLSDLISLLSLYLEPSAGE